MLIHSKSMSIASKLALLLVFCLWSSSRAEIASRPARVEEITIFVHGVIGLKLSISLYHLFNLVRDKTANTVYQKTIEGVRNDPFFFENQPIGHVGLQKIDVEDLEPGNAGVLAAYLYDSIDAMSAPSLLRARCALGTQGERREDPSVRVPRRARDARLSDCEVPPEFIEGCPTFAKEMTDVTNHKQNARHHYFTYGWSGLLSKQARETEAEAFLTALENVCSESRARNYTPKIRLIGFSHGGNLCMQLAHTKNRLQKDTNLLIDELMLVGTPILNETQTALNDPLFARVYNIYSPADQVQTKEIFSGEFFAKQAFEPTPDTPLPAKLTQIELHVQKDRIKKNRYTKKEKTFGVDDYSPGHMELWFFGWTPNHYRADYPLHPLPTVVFAPYIMNRLHALDLDEQHVVVTLHPENNIMSVGAQTMPFLNQDVLQSLKDTAEFYAPKEYSVAEYREHCKKAYWAAREERTPLPERR